jgi:CheY-like chemotaxis protein
MFWRAPSKISSSVGGQASVAELAGIQFHESTMNNGEARLVVVDDDVDAAAVLAASLQLEGYSVRVGHDAAQALTIVAEFSPLGVLLDLGLPDQDRLEVARRLRADWGPVLVLVAVSGRASEREKRAADAAGFDCVIVKPVDLRLRRTSFPPTGSAAVSS